MPTPAANPASCLRSCTSHVPPLTPEALGRQLREKQEVGTANSMGPSPADSSLQQRFGAGIR